MTTTFSDDRALPGAADGAPEVPGVGSLVEVINDEIRVFHELLGTLQQVTTVTISSSVNLLIVGLFLVGFVIFAPDGFLGLIKKFRKHEK